MIETPRFVEVVTRYGGRRHIAIAQGQLAASGDAGRQRTLCMNTSSWTIASWALRPDHPLGLTAQQMQELPWCNQCQTHRRYLTPLPQDLRVPVKDDEPTVAEQREAIKDKLRANLFDGDERGTLTMNVSALLNQVAEILVEDDGSESEQDVDR